jgi:hypothetical protein
MTKAYTEDGALKVLVSGEDSAAAVGDEQPPGLRQFGEPRDVKAVESNVHPTPLSATLVD